MTSSVADDVRDHAGATTNLMETLNSRFRDEERLTKSLITNHFPNVSPVSLPLAAYFEATACF
jgi:hypothetical protein